MTPRTAFVCCSFVLLSLQQGLGSAAADVQLEMKNVRLHVADGIVLDVTRLRGVMISKASGTPPVFDDQRSYTLRLRSADIAMDVASLQNLLTRHVFAFEGSPVSDTQIEASGTVLKIKGKLRKGVSVPFSLTASVAATPDGRMRLHTESLKALGLPAKGLLELFGLELDDLMAMKNRRGIEVDDNDIIIAPGQVLPPPEIVGRLASVAIRGNKLVQTFDDPGAGRPARLVPPSPSARNYVYFGGGTIRFGKLTMHDADLQLIDADPSDPFDFFPARYNVQLVAGYSKNTPAKGLKTFMPDFDDITRLVGSRSRRR